MRKLFLLFICQWARMRLLVILLLLISSNAQFLKAQQRTIRGRVFDSERIPLAGVNVQIKGSAQGSSSGADGGFEVSIPKDAILVFSYVGYQSLEIQAGNENDLRVYLSEAVNTLEELVLTANRTLTPLDQVPQQLRLLDRQTIRHTVGSELADVLKKHATVDIIQYPGLLSGVGIRGFQPQIPVNS
ncbi:MAG: hypothetical protein HC880_12330, partial [Bacteroidia bacterium]|nr:hypothetical protein [Bacteroidia bacterium]